MKNKQKRLNIKEIKQIKAIEDYWKHVAESDELTKKDFNIDRDSIPFEERKKYLMNMLKKNLNLRV